MAVHARDGLDRDPGTERLLLQHHTDVAGFQVQVRALAAALEQLADAIDVLSETGTPTEYVDEHVQQARLHLMAIW